MHPVFVVDFPCALIRARNAASNSLRFMRATFITSQIWPKGADVGICERMKATALTSIGLVLFSFPALAANSHKHHARSQHPAQHATATHHATAMHTEPVHEKEASITREEDREQERIQQRVRALGVQRAAAAAAAAAAKKPCLREPVTIGRGAEEERFSLTRCDGSPADGAVDHLSMLARPETFVRPVHGAPFAGLHRVDVKLLERLQAVADHFAHGHPVSMHIISGYRPMSAGSYHQSAQALDFRVDGVRNEELVAFCKTLNDTGCGYYPNSSFVHMDVRPVGTGHVAWIDASGPGEAAHYVSAWPPPPETPRELGQQIGARLAKILAPLPVDEHPATIELDDLAHGMDAGAQASAAPVPKAHQSVQQ
jgi:hypothetical protein